MHIEDTNISLIVKYLEKQISETEKQQLFQWIYSNPENEHFFYNLKDIWETVQFNEIVRTADTETEWRKFSHAAFRKESTLTVSTPKRNTIKKKLYTALKIAALVIITFGAGFFVQKLIPEKTTYTSINVPYGAKSKLELPDGSMIWVNSGSTLRYPNNFNHQVVDLFLEGEAFFNIAENPQRKLNVKTSSINIQVLGTTFNVKAYNEEDVVETTLVKGSISITGHVDGQSIKNPIILKPNERAVLVKSKNNLEIDNTTQELNKQDSEPNHTNKEIITVKTIIPQKMNITEGVDVESFVSWKDNKLVFKSERFDALATKLERWYNVEIIFKDEMLKNSRYTGTFEKETFEQAILALSISLPFTYKIDKNKIEIIGKKN